MFSSISVNAIEREKADIHERVNKLEKAGKFSQVIQIWQEQAEIYRNENNSNKEAEVLFAIAEVYNKVGNFDLAIGKLNYIIDLNIKKPKLNALVLEEIGNSFQGKGKYKQAVSAYQKSLRLNNSLSCLNNLVKTWIVFIDKTMVELEGVKEKEYLESDISQYNDRLLEYNREKRLFTNAASRYKLEKKVDILKKLALERANEAVKIRVVNNSLSEVYALINWHKLTSQSISKAQLFHARKILESELPSRALVFSLINWSKVDIDNNIYWLKKAEEVVSLIQDPVAQSHVAQELGQYYYDNDRFEAALQYTQQSQLIAQSYFLFENLYRAQWLAGKAYLRLNQRSDSLTAYKNAIAALDTVNQNITSWDSVQKAKYRLDTKPLYHELIDLLLGQERVSKQDIKQAIFVADKLRFSELQNYFGDDCFEVRSLDSTQAILEKEKNETLLYSIVLDDKSYVILKLPDGSFHLNKLDIPKSEIQKLAVAWRKNLTAGNTNKFQIQGRELYDLLISPFEQKLELSEFEVLIFIHDGILRNLPMAALYDGDRYLAQKWASVSSLGLNIATENLPSSNTQALIFGLSRPNQPGWTDLEMVDREVNLVHQLIGGQKYLDDDFTVSNLTNRLDKKFYSVVHLATHGYFAGNVKDSFLLAYDGQISITDLEKILQNQTAIDLLVLSACETAITSDSSLLGLAGVAARNGVKSILGSLWLVQDDLQSEIMGDFYTYLANSDNNKAIALQKVQQKMISQYAHPQNWAALNLIGDYR
ncbi:CHAT domain-containing protein [Waterburya agarophytonicola K14]|uniref:CHAT domain-containing protein n=1 Tax=Waterburya agarophytonicola KI4 TaxID=2874699 RepID=A0A964FEG7_9CYAN|nr:CHAT domain-containing protein [Waterburya agarophytonicola]MCC0175872.1 CHAT domain-containing protein [Waterburya agarophytonicola KI4]